MLQMLFSRVLLVALILPGSALAQPAVSSEIAPTGKLRVGVNASTPVLLKRESGGKPTGGVALEMGKFIAERLGVAFELVPYADSTAYTQSFGKGEWDIGFGAQTPLVADKADFIAPVVLTDYLFVAALGREFANIAQIDRPGIKIVVGTNSSSHQFLRRTLKSAELVGLSGGGVEALREGKADLYAASASNAHQTADGVPGAKIVAEPFMSDRYMVSLPKGRSPGAQARIAEIVNEAKKTGTLAKALEQLNMKGVRVAPN